MKYDYISACFFNLITCGKIETANQGEQDKSECSILITGERNQLHHRFVSRPEQRSSRDRVGGGDGVDRDASA